jgi:hypothetical protein
LGLAHAGPKSILGPAQPMTQDYFGFCSMRGPRKVGSWRARAPCVRWGVPSTEVGAQTPRVRKGVPTTEA